MNLRNLTKGGKVDKNHLLLNFIPRYIIKDYCHQTVRRCCPRPSKKCILQIPNKHHHSGASPFHLGYRKVVSSNTSCLEAHAGFFRLLMKGIFNPYLL